MDRKKPRLWRRRGLIVDLRYQLGFAAQVFLVQAIVTLSFQATLQLRIRSLVQQTNSPEVAGALEKMGRESFDTMLFVTAITGSLLFMLGLWFSNKIMGPMPRLRKAFDRLSQGDYSVRLKFRPGDTFEALAGDFNKLAESLEKEYRSSAGGAATLAHEDEKVEVLSV